MGHTTIATASSHLADQHSHWSIGMDQYTHALLAIIIPGKVAVQHAVQAILPALVVAAAAAPAEASSCAAVSPAGELTERLASTEPSARLSHVKEVVMRVVHEVTGNVALDASQPLMEAGVDSLAATELARCARLPALPCQLRPAHPCHQLRLALTLPPLTPGFPQSEL